MKIQFKLVVSLCSVLLLKATSAQQIIEKYVPQKDMFRFNSGPSDMMPYGPKGYTLVLPSSDQVKGTILSLEDFAVNVKDTSKSTSLYREAGSKGFAVLHIATGIPLDLYFSPQSLAYVDSVAKEVFSTHKIPNRNIFLQGIMTGGHRALKYVEYCKSGRSLFKPDIKGVFLSESAIDWVRQWFEAQKQVRDHLTENGFFEGNLVTYIFKQNFKDTPITNMEKYLEFSSYSYYDTSMRHIPLFKDIAVRAYTFADTDYWFSAPGKGVNDSNFPDMLGLVNELKLAGNKNAELIVFTGANKSGKHRAQSATWDLVDKNELVDWVTKQSR